VDCKLSRNPGKVTIRRLNRTEYNNTIRDLVGIDYRPADDFPADDVGYGFDNIGDVLSLPPLLMEKYLAAAEQIIEKKLAAEADAKTPRRIYSPDEFKLGGDGKRTGTAYFELTGAGDVSVEHEFPGDGEYVFKVRAAARPAGNQKVKMSVRVDGKEIKAVEVEALEDRPGLYEVKANVKAGTRKVSVAFTNPGGPGEPDTQPKAEPKGKRRPPPRFKDRRLLVMHIDVFGPAGAAEQAAADRLIPPRRQGEGRSEWARGVITRFATRAFRRPVAKDEIDRLLKFVEVAEKEGDSPEKGLALALQAVLVSPHFLFRVELDPQPDSPTVRPLNDHELASRLSYFLWSTLPDATLMSLAAKGELQKDAVLEQQVRRMLADPRAREFVENFSGQWLQTRNLKTFAPDAKLFPGFDEELRRAMIAETEKYFETVLREDRSVLEFLDSDWTVVNERLARHYGLDGVKGREFRKVSLAGTPRGGVLTQASVLAITSNPTRTSPVKRGKWVLEQLMGTPPPPPPPNVEELSEDEATVLKGTLRQRMEQHRHNPACANCHAKMDPLGFGLENFDAVGSYRTKDGRFPIDPSGTLPNGKSFQGPAGLKKILLADKDLFVRCLAEKLLTYALGRGLEYYDKCAVDEVCTAASRNNHRFTSLIVAVVKSEPFRKRRGSGG
jgi:hypothetical protein